MNQIQEFYRRRFKKKEYYLREKIWQVLCEQVFQRMINKENTLMDIGAGYCEFINNIECKTKIAVDLNPDTKNKAKAGVQVLNMNILAIPAKFDKKIDVIFMSNFLEHLSSKSEVIDVLRKAHKLLRQGGQIIIIQPNIDLVKEKYWDFIDHSIALNMPSLVEALETVGFETKLMIKHFLPYTTKNKLRFYTAFLVKLYLMLPSSLRLFAGQSLVKAIK